MTRKVVTSFCVLAVGLPMICLPIFAHHGSAAAYDYTYRITTQATVTEFVWSNPHVLLRFDIKNDKGEVEHWGTELASPGNLIRGKAHWTKNTFQPGDVITVSLVPAKEGRPFGTCAQYVRADGQVLNKARRCGPVEDINKLPIKPGYTAVEVKMPKDNGEELESQEQ